MVTRQCIWQPRLATLKLSNFWWSLGRHQEWNLRYVEISFQMITIDLVSVSVGSVHC